MKLRLCPPTSTWDIWSMTTTLLKLTFKILGKKLKLKVGFYFRNKSCFSLEARRRLVEATFLPVLEYGDLLYINASAHCLHMLDIVYHGATRFITNSRALSHHCTLYSKVNCPSLFLRRLSHGYVFIYKAILGKLPCFVTAYVPETCPPWVTVSGHGPYDCCWSADRTGKKGL